MADEQQARSLVRSAAAELGGLDALVNNAGVMLLGPMEGTNTDEWRRMVDVNVLGLLYCTHAGLGHLLSAAEDEPRHVADLVNVSSVAGRRATGNSGVYNLTKFGVNAFSESLRQEITRQHVRVSVVEPGAVKTELRSHLRPEIRSRPSFVDEIEILDAEDIADAIAYIVTRPRHEAVNEILIRPTEQEG